MERKPAGRYYIFEWSIENFSCWNPEIHGRVIQSPKLCYFRSLYPELYPRGISGDDEHLVVHIYGKFVLAIGKLSYIGPDGSLLCTQHFSSKGHISVLKLPPGPKFQEVVARIKKSEALHENRLTVRFLMMYNEKYTEYMHTEISVFEVSFKMSWKTLKNLDSNEFSNKKTHLWIGYPQGEKRDKIQLGASKDKNDSSKIMMELKPLNFTKKILVLARMSVLDIEGELVKTEEDEHVFLDGNVWHFSISLAKDEMKDLKESQTLILSLKMIPSINYRYSLSLFQFQDSKFDIHASNSSMSIRTKKILKSVTKSNQKDTSITILTKELMCLYQDQDFSDFQLKCGDVSIPVHKNILSARSPVFKTMLSTDMQEAASGCMDIVDLDPSTLGLFLTYLYTGAVEELQCERSLQLYYAADKYQVPYLKKECADFLCLNVSISNVCDILSLANKHQDDRLISVVHEFILNNFNDVLSSDEWMSFMRNEPLLAVETLTHFAQKKYVRKSDVYEN